MPGWAAYLGNHILHKSCVQLERPLIAPTLHAGRVIAGAVTSIGIHIRYLRTGVFRMVYQRGMLCSLVS